MAELKINNATYGRDTVGAKKLMANLNAKLNTGIKSLKGKEYTSVVNAVKQNWSGADADKFLSEFEAAVTELQASFKKFSDIIQGAIENDTKSFASMQETTAGLINK